MNEDNRNFRIATEDIISNLLDEASTEFINELNQFSGRCMSAIDEQPETLLCSLFLSSIKEHYVPNEINREHLYLKRYEIPQIQLFDLLITKFPFVVSSHLICNNIIHKWIDNLSSAAIIDVGIGRGIQMETIINELQYNKSLEELTIIGIEPFPDAILYARRRIEDATKKVRFKVIAHFIEGFAEDINSFEVAKLLPRKFGKLIINSSLALHHIPSVELRKRFFDQMKELNPDAIILTEPHSDHLTSDWKQRVKNAWTHYRSVFDTIDVLKINNVEKNGLKMFFGREIEDVIGTAETQRVEKHQLSQNWISYIQSIGMKAQNNLTVPNSLSSDAITILPYHDGVLMMNRNEVNVLAIIVATKS